jgi:signal peptidase II
MSGRMLRYGLGLAAGIVLLDQAAKWLVLARFATRAEALEITPFFNLVLAWNRGISFSLFHSEQAYAPLVLSGLALAISAGLVGWLGRIAQRWPATGIGLIVGGAVGNVVDRLRFGAVVDFLDCHWGEYHWPAFNLADTAITIGVIFLVIDGLFRRPEGSKRTAAR